MADYAKKLQNSLVLLGLEEKDLPAILQQLQQSALEKKSEFDINSKYKAEITE